MPISSVMLLRTRLWIDEVFNVQGCDFLVMALFQKASGILPEIKLRQCAVFLLIPCGQGLCRTVREWKLPKTISRYRLPQCAVGQSGGIAKSSVLRLRDFKCRYRLTLLQISGLENLKGTLIRV